jgi:hypothetical protein
VNDPKERRSGSAPSPVRRYLRLARAVRRTLLTAAFLFAGLATGALLAVRVHTYLVLPPDPPPLAWANSDETGTDPSFTAVPQTAPLTRPIYPYSVVPGGVRNRWDLEREYDQDPVVRDHYRDFRFGSAQLIRLTEDQTAYVSYRIGGKIFWTSKKVRLHRGEKLLTDGHITARARCGNQVSQMPHPATSPMEPSAAEMEKQLPPQVPVPTILDAGLRRPNFPGFGPPSSPTTGTGGWLPPIIPLIPYGGTPATPQPGGPHKPVYPPLPTPQGTIHVPEAGELGPATLFLVLTGLAGVYRRYRGRG